MGMTGMSGMGDTMSMGTAGVGTLITAYKQFSAAREARKAAEALNIKKKTPSGIIQNTVMARNAAGSYGLPGQGNIQNQLDADTANAAENLNITQQSPAAIAAGVIATWKNQMQQDARLGVQAAQNKQQLTNQLYAANQVNAGYDEKNFNYNVEQPFKRALAEAAQLEGAAVENANKGLQQQGNAIGSMFGGSGKSDSGTINSGIETNTNMGTGQPIGQQQAWGGMAPQQQAWGGMGGTQQQTPNITTDQVTQYRIRTGDWTSSDNDVMGKMFANGYGLKM
jgi:hypothetical protein